MTTVDAIYQFPKGFLWGTATAAHQVEGSNTNNDWWAWEQAGRVHEDHSSATSLDWWRGRYVEDFDRMAADGHNTHRLSIEWSRIEPNPSTWDEDALAFYRSMLIALRERGIEPMVTLQHFSHPLWFMERGGWEADDAHEVFARYVRKVVRELGDLVTLWCTINEPNIVVASGYLYGDFPPGATDFRRALQVGHAQCRAHVAAYHTIKAIHPAAQVGFSLYIRIFDPFRPNNPLDRWTANAAFDAFCSAWPRALTDGVYRTPLWKKQIAGAIGAFDWFGVNYYSRDMVKFDLSQPASLFGDRSFHPDDEVSETGFIAAYPKGLFRAIEWAKGFGKPIYVTETGVEDSQDSMRRRYMVGHIAQMWRAVNFNYQVRGLYWWTLADNFEWERGWTQRFGLYELDLSSFERKPRHCARLYAEIAQANGLSSDMVQRYAASMLDTVFPR